MIPDFVYHPDAPESLAFLLPEGFWACTIEEIEQKLANNFAESRTRQSLFSGVQFYLRDIRALDLNGRIWLDGSFVTGKANPADIDAILLVSFDAFNRLSTDDQIEAQALIQDGPKIKTRYDVHVFGAIAVPPSETGYLDSVDLVRDGLRFFSETKRFTGFDGESGQLKKGVLQLDFGVLSEIEKVNEWLEIIQ